MSQERLESSLQEDLPNDERVNNSITTRLCEMIRWNLPNFGNHFRRLMGLGGEPDIDRDQHRSNDMNQVGSDVEYSTEDFSLEETSSSESTPFAISVRPPNLPEFSGANYPSTSDAFSSKMEMSILLSGEIK
uniref:RbsR_0 protein n=1 Tax=Fopius arisanus TaxID=64838 RepID=A0A0C9PJ33_9HYME